MITNARERLEEARLYGILDLGYTAEADVVPVSEAVRPMRIRRTHPRLQSFPR